MNLRTIMLVASAVCFVLGMIALGGVLGAAAASLGLRRLVQV